MGRIEMACLNRHPPTHGMLPRTGLCLAPNRQIKLERHRPSRLRICDVPARGQKVDLASNATVYKGGTNAGSGTAPSVKETKKEHQSQCAHPSGDTSS